MEKDLHYVSHLCYVTLCKQCESVFTVSSCRCTSKFNPEGLYFNVFICSVSLCLLDVLQLHALLY